MHGGLIRIDPALIRPELAQLDPMSEEPPVSAVLNCSGDKRCARVCRLVADQVKRCAGTPRSTCRAAFEAQTAKGYEVLRTATSQKLPCLTFLKTLA